MQASTSHPLGIRENAGLFVHQMLQVFMIGMTIGLQRTVVPVLAERDFGVPANSFMLLFAFVVSFGFVKGAMNFVSGRLSERVGRRRVLIWGWLVAIPIPFMILLAPDWNWIVAANILLGINQGLAWSMTVTAKHDIVRADQRGLATGLNEFAGYGGVALAGLVTGYIATYFDPRWSLFVLGLCIVAVALAVAWKNFGETLGHARAEAASHKAGGGQRLRPRYPDNVSDKHGSWEIFSLVTWRHRTFAAVTQAGHVEKYVDALMWALVPLYLHTRGATLIEIGWVTGAYGLVWATSQLWTGPLSDRVGRKWPAAIGMFVCSAGVLIFPVASGLAAWSMAAGLTGIGMALLYPTLISAIGDISHPSWRGSGLGIYRFWRDLGYGIGALALGAAASVSGHLETGFWLVGGAMALSGAWLALAMEETHPRINPAPAVPEIKSDDCVSVDRLKTGRGGYFVIDVRSPEEFASGHVEGAVNIPLDRLRDGLGGLPSGQVPVTACGKGGGRSSEAAAVLRSLGFARARWLCGGTNAWLAEPAV